MDLPSALRHWAGLTATKTAVASARGHLSYAELFSQATALAQTLTNLPGPRVGIRTTDPLAMAVGFHAAALAGKALSVLDPAWPQDLLRRTATGLNATTVLTTQADGPLPVGLTALLLGPAQQAERARPTTARELAEVDPSAELLTICTSGSTGDPKAVVRSRASWEASLTAGAEILGAVPEAVTLCPGPISHGLGLYALVESIHTGGTFVAPGRWQLQQAVELATRYLCTRLVSVPTIIDRLSAAPGQLTASLRCVVSGGEALPAELVTRLRAANPALDLIEYYGSSEHSLIAYRRHDTQDPTPGPFTGTPFPGVRLHVHADTPGAAGALFVDSPFNARGYDPAGGVEIDRCGTSTSVGDTARLLPDGRLTVFGRSGGMLNLNGNNVHPGEIAEAFAAAGLPGVRIQAQPGAAGPRLIAYADQSPEDPELLRGRLGELLPGYKIPHLLVIVPRWPLTASGKISEALLPAADTPGLNSIEVRRSR